MVPFHRCPARAVVGPMCDAGVAIGLALSPGELPSVPSPDGYRCVFVSAGHRARPALFEAVADLERNNWSVDETPA